MGDRCGRVRARGGGAVIGQGTLRDTNFHEGIWERLRVGGRWATNLHFKHRLTPIWSPYLSAAPIAGVLAE